MFVDFLPFFFERNRQRVLNHVQPFGESWVLWNFANDSIVCMVLNVVFASGFFILLFASFCIDHFSLFGLSQAFNTDISAALRISTKSTGAASQHSRVVIPPAIADFQNPLAGLTTRGLYSIVAHPIMTGMLLGKQTPIAPDHRPF
jgi:hypothetical protein